MIIPTTQEKVYEIISLFSNLKNNRWELDKYYELIDYYIREKYFELVPQLQYSDSAYVTLPQRMDSQASTVSKNAAAMFSKQILSLDEESIRLNFDKEALRFSKELKPMFALLARGLSEILRVYLKDESRGFLNTISEAANYLICEGTVGVACFLDEIRGSFVLDVIPPHNLYYTAQLGSSPEQIFCRAEMTGTQLMKQYAAEGLTPETKYKVIYYYRPVIYDFKDVLATLTPEMQKNWRLSLIILDTQKVIYEHNFANRPIYIARLNSFNRSQYGTGAGISALTAVISKNEALYWTKTHEIMTIYPPIVINALLKYTSNIGGDQVINRNIAGETKVDLPEFRELLAQGQMPEPIRLTPTTLTPTTTESFIRMTSLEISQAFGFSSIEESGTRRTDNPTATQITREAFISDSMFHYKAQAFYKDILDGVIRQIMRVIQFTPAYNRWFNENLEAIAMTGLDPTKFGIDYYSIATKQAQQEKKANYMEYTQFALATNMPNLVTPEIVADLQDSLDIGKN